MFLAPPPSPKVEALNDEYIILQNLKLAVELRNTLASNEYINEAKQVSEYVNKMLTQLKESNVR